MPDISPVLLAAAGASLVLGILVGWLIRSSKVKREKEAIHAGWQEQITAQRNEHDRIARQNKNLMQQVAQSRAVQKDADARANELSETLREALQDRESLQAELRQATDNLDAAALQRDQLKQDLADRTADNLAANEARTKALRDKDSKIFNLGRELESWKSRLPPLLEKFRERTLEAEQLEVELETANGRIAEFERRRDSVVDNDSNETRLEPADPGALATELSASNEQYDDEPSGTGEPPSAANDDGDRDDDDDAGRPSATQTGRIPNGAIVADDNLQRIKGVGPAIEKTLAELGITRFEQIVELSEVDIDRIAEKLRGFRSRFYREDWIGQARLLQQDQSGH